ncbi:MAG: hypothetical protein HC897_17145 [Thermoanaerobaculia bacterium]|nr:hypothetical protein [Thermoanaerobaculia bacterium]
MLYHQLKPSGLERAVLYFAGRPVAILELPASGPAESLLLSTDHLGTPMLASTLAGAVSWSGGFEPFGADWSGAEAAGVFLRFPGQWGDEAWGAPEPHSQLLYNVHRWLVVDLGRYDRPDPLSFSQWLNSYSYVAANPLLYYDSLGLHREGGPWHPDGPFACKGSDSCAELRQKISQFSHAISSHRRWDRVRGTDRHAGEIAEFINGIEECKRLYKAKGCDQPCEPCRKLLELSPVVVAGYIIYKLVEIIVCPALVPVTP